MARPSSGERTVEAPARGGGLPRRAILLLAALLVLPLAFVPRAEAFVYWANFETNTIARANLDGTGANQSFTTASEPCGIAVDASHVYWSDFDALGRANLDGSGANQSFITTPIAPCGIAVDASHVYWSISGGGTSGTIGRANLDGTGVDNRFICEAGAPQGLAVDALSAPPQQSPSNAFSFCEVTMNKKKGTAKLTVNVPGPGKLLLLKRKGVKRDTEQVEAAGKEKLSVKPRGKVKKELNRTGKAKVKAKVTYTPDGGAANTHIEKIKLVKR
jgi:hypothetical protein